MSGRQEFGPDAVGVIEQLAEFDSVVAHHARIGRASDGVFIDEVIDDAAKFFFEIECVKRNAQSLGDAATVFGIGRTAAALFVIGSVVEHRQQRG